MGDRITEGLHLLVASAQGIGAGGDALFEFVIHFPHLFAGQFFVGNVFRMTRMRSGVLFP